MEPHLVPARYSSTSFLIDSKFFFANLIGGLGLISALSCVVYCQSVARAGR